MVVQLFIRSIRLDPRSKQRRRGVRFIPAFIRSQRNPRAILVGFPCGGAVKKEGCPP
jgi:hypothetical protein